MRKIAGSIKTVTVTHIQHIQIWICLPIPKLPLLFLTSNTITPTLSKLDDVIYLTYCVIFCLLCGLLQFYIASSFATLSLKLLLIWVLKMSLKMYSFLFAVPIVQNLHGFYNLLPDLLNMFPHHQFLNLSHLFLHATSRVLTHKGRDLMPLTSKNLVAPSSHNIQNFVHSLVGHSRTTSWAFQSNLMLATDCSSSRISSTFLPQAYAQKFSHPSRTSSNISGFHNIFENIHS